MSFVISSILSHILIILFALSLSLMVVCVILLGLPYTNL